MTDPVWSDSFHVSVTYDVELTAPARATLYRGAVYFVLSVSVTVTFEAKDKRVGLWYKGTAARAKKDGTQGKQLMQFGQYSFIQEPEEIGSIVEEARRRAARHFG